MISPPLPKNLWWAFAACLLVRLFYLTELGDKMTAFYYEHAFAQQALSLLEGRGMQTHDGRFLETQKLQEEQLPVLLQPTQYPPWPADGKGYYAAIDMPGVCWIFALIWKLTGHPSFWAIKTVQTLLSALLIFPIWDIARRLFDQRAAAWAAWLYAFCLPLAYLSQMASKEPWECFTLVPAVCFTLRFFQEGRGWNLVAGVFFFVAAVFIRTNLILLMGALCGVGLLLFPWKRCIAFLLMGCLVILMALVPWVVRNKKYVGPKVGVKEGFYWAILGGIAAHDPVLSKELSSYEVPHVQSDGTEFHLFHEPPEVASRTKQILKERFGWYLGLSARNFFWGPWLHLESGNEMLSPEGQDYALFHSRTGRGHRAYWLAHPFANLFKKGTRLFELLIMVSSLFVFWFRRQQWRECLWLSMAYGVLLFTYALIHIESRYLAPHIWAVFLLAGACLSKISEEFNFNRIFTPPFFSLKRNK